MATNQQFRDAEMEMVRYMAPNRGDHPVYGMATRRFYGNRRGAGVETFLVHRSDIAAQPQYFVVVSSVPKPPSRPVVAPPPPTKIEGEKASPEPEPEPMVLEGETPPPPVAARALNSAKFDLQVLPGVTPRIAKEMAGASLVTAESIIDAGVDGLSSVKGLGPLKASLIYDYVKENFNASN